MRPSSIRSFVAMTALLTSALLTAPAAAQMSQYDVTYTTTGTANSQITGLPPNSTSYTTNGGTTQGSAGISVGVSGSGSFTAGCSGPITAQLTWNAGINNDPAPAAVIVQEHSVASFTTTSQPGSTVTGSCDNGLKVTSPAGVPSYTADSSTYTGKSGLSFSLPACSPVVNIAGSTGNSTPTPICSGSVSVTYTVTASPVTLTLTGTKPDASGNPNILVGQGCGAKINGIPTGTSWATTYNWSVSGTTFQTWSNTTPANPNATPPTLANPNASYFVGGPGPLTNATAHWYWNDLGPKPKAETVTCAATMTPPAGQGAAFTVTVTKTVYVQTPAFTADGTGGYMQVNTRAPLQNGLISLYAGPSAGQAGGSLHGLPPQRPLRLPRSARERWNWCNSRRQTRVM